MNDESNRRGMNDRRHVGLLIPTVVVVVVVVVFVVVVVVDNIILSNHATTQCQPF